MNEPPMNAAADFCADGSRMIRPRSSSGYGRKSFLAKFTLLLVAVVPRRRVAPFFFAGKPRATIFSFI